MSYHYNYLIIYIYIYIIYIYIYVYILPITDFKYDHALVPQVRLGLRDKSNHINKDTALGAG